MPIKGESKGCTDLLVMYISGTFLATGLLSKSILKVKDY